MNRFWFAMIRRLLDIVLLTLVLGQLEGTLDLSVLPLLLALSLIFKFIYFHAGVAGYVSIRYRVKGHHGRDSDNNKNVQR